MIQIVLKRDAPELSMSSNAFIKWEKELLIQTILQIDMSQAFTNFEWKRIRKWSSILPKLVNQVLLWTGDFHSQTI